MYDCLSVSTSVGGSERALMTVVVAVEAVVIVVLAAPAYVCFGQLVYSFYVEKQSYLKQNKEGYNCVQGGQNKIIWSEKKGVGFVCI